MIRPGKFQYNQYGRFRVPGTRNEGSEPFWKQAVLAAIPAFVGGVVPIVIEHWLVGSKSQLKSRNQNSKPKSSSLTSIFFMLASE